MPLTKRYKSGALKECSAFAFLSNYSPLNFRKIKQATAKNRSLRYTHCVIFLAGENPPGFRHASLIAREETLGAIVQMLSCTQRIITRRFADAAVFMAFLLKVIITHSLSGRYFISDYFCYNTILSYLFSNFNTQLSTIFLIKALLYCLF